MKMLISSLLLFFAINTHGQSFLDQPNYAQLWVGSQGVDQAWSITDFEGAAYLADLDRVRRLGFSFQTPAKRGGFEYGWDLSASLGYENSPRWFFLVDDQGSDIGLRFDGQLWLVDLGLGGFVSARPVSWLRLYASAGPSLYWGHFRHDNADTSGGNSDALVIDTRESDNYVSVALYGRLGAEIIFNRDFTLGVSARYTNSDYDFKQSGKLDLTAPQFFLTLGRSL